ncbi:unnamed protein product [Coregonus sp. 'balchen']|nr:unnamed protein product [Coregonus sp. 'balchen']
MNVETQEGKREQWSSKTEFLLTVCGVGRAELLILIYDSIIYLVILAWTLFYLVFSFSSQLPWASCGNTWNTGRRRVLAISGGIEEVGSVRWELMLCLLACWAVCYFCIWKGISFVAGFAVFSVLGFMAQKQGVSVAMVAESGPGLAFIAFPQAAAMMPFPQLWTVCFFFMLLLLGIDTQFVIMEGVITSFTDLFPVTLRRPRYREGFVLLFCLSCFLIQLTLITELIDYYGCSGACVLFVAVFESLAVGWIFGADHMEDAIKDMTAQRPCVLFRLCWRYFTPLVSLRLAVLCHPNDELPLTRKGKRGKRDGHTEVETFKIN